MSENGRTTDALHALRSLVEQSKHAERSVGGALVGVHYAGVRELQTSTERFTMFAVAIGTSDQAKDIFYARTPEVAKFVALLMTLSGSIVAAVIGGIEASKSSMV